jgi:hypothetical protein
VVVPDRRRATGDDEPVQVALDLIAVDDRARVPVRYVKLGGAAVAMLIVAFVGGNLLPAGGGIHGPGAASPSSPSTTPSPPASRPSPSTIAGSPDPFPYGGEIVPGTYWVRWLQGDRRIRLTVPAGWWSADTGMTISRHPLDTPGPAIELTAHAVTHVETAVCGVAGSLAEVGPTVEDLATAIASQRGILRSGPTDATVGGYPARRFQVAIPGTCPVPDRELIWSNAAGRGFALPAGGTATIYIVDVDGVRLVITSHHVGASQQDIAQLDAIFGSIVIEPAADGRG